MNVDTGTFTAITDTLAALGERVDTLEARLADATRAEEIMRRAEMPWEWAAAARGARPRATARHARPRHLRVVSGERDRP
jgi:hypothetical protein